MLICILLLKCLNRYFNNTNEIDVTCRGIMMSTTNKNPLIEQWRKLIVLKKGKWVLFENGTIIIFHEEIENIEKEAKSLMEKWGPVAPGTNLGDFSVEHLDNDPGWVVNYVYEDMHNYVSPTDFEDQSPSDNEIGNDVTIGLIGREKRKKDASSLVIIHIETIEKNK